MEIPEKIRFENTNLKFSPKIEMKETEIKIMGKVIQLENQIPIQEFKKPPKKSKICEFDANYIKLERVLHLKNLNGSLNSAHNY